MTLTDDERVMQERGFKTIRMAREEKFWYRFAYHGFREFGTDGCVLCPAMDESSGEFYLHGADAGGRALFRAAVPRKQVKQICDHPALAAGRTEAYQEYDSGKWHLFTELLEESLDSGQKVVVYSQYLGMIDIATRYLTEKRVDHACLTGASTNRGQIVERFNAEPGCRVFAGSLKAGGVGIDLVAASVVIHYDRWWNAAREDQATDRVHRIGQTRGVQVFKRLNEGTLEEKIAAIIDKKRNLMDGIVKEDDPTLLKTFSKGGLIELLSMPAELSWRRDTACKVIQIDFLSNVTIMVTLNVVCVVTLGGLL